jgi:putative monooxygenase
VKKGERGSMSIHVKNPFQDSERLWLGLDTPGMTRKVFRTITRELVGSEHFSAGLTIFDPGESSSLHNHPNSEEVNFIVSGSGVALSGDLRIEFKKNDCIFIPTGEMHQHINTSDEPLVLLWIYTPQDELPTF